MMYDSGLDPLTGLPRQKKPAAQKPPSFQAAGGFGGSLPPGSLNPGGSPSWPGGQPPLPSNMPDYAGLIRNDPLYQQLQKDLGAQGIQDAAARAAQTQRALVLFGQVPQFDGLSGVNPDWLNQDVNDQTRQLAEQNTQAGLSLAARQSKAFNDQVRQIRNSLAARGALRSGEAGHQFQEAQHGFDQAKFDATQELIDFISGLQAGFAQSERGRQGQLSQGAEAAAGRVPPQGGLARTPQPGSRAVDGSGNARVGAEDVQDVLKRLLGGAGGGGGRFQPL
jgi:hypothetical protein